MGTSTKGQQWQTCIEEAGAHSEGPGCRRPVHIWLEASSCQIETKHTAVHLASSMRNGNEGMHAHRWHDLHGKRCYSAAGSLRSKQVITEEIPH